MKTQTLSLVILFSFFVSLSAFRCGTGITDYCTTNTLDSFGISLTKNLNNTSVLPYDTLRLSSSFGKKVTSYNNKAFVLKDSIEGSLSFQAYRVIQSNSTAALQIANIEFNYFPIVGANNTSPYGGSGNFNFAKIADSFKLSYNLIPGRAGLYVFVNNVYIRDKTGYGSIDTTNDRCNYLQQLIEVPVAQKRIDIWDSIGVSELKLANSTYNYTVVRKADKNYFFLRVN